VDIAGGRVVLTIPEISEQPPQAKEEGRT